MFRKIGFPVRGDYRGNLIAIEGETDIPFEIKRVYYIFATQSDVVRGLHAHSSLQQVLICVNGSCRILVDDAERREEFLLDTPSSGLLISSGVWREMKDFSKDAVLLVLASEHYDESDYIRDYEDFLEKFRK